jgi:hypothetical protein
MYRASARTANMKRIQMISPMKIGGEYAPPHT